jgi:hypothetical protein
MAENEQIVDQDCTLCTPEEEVGCVTRDDRGLVACEGCRREWRIKSWRDHALEVEGLRDAIEKARKAGHVSNDAARAASVALGLEGDEAMLACRLIAQGSDPASLEYVLTGSVSEPIAKAHREGPGSLSDQRGTDDLSHRATWLALAHWSADESKQSTLRDRVQQFITPILQLGSGKMADWLAWTAAKRAEIEDLPFASARPDLFGNVEEAIAKLGREHPLRNQGWVNLYDADLGFASAYWSGMPVAAVLGVYNGEPYVAVGSDQSRGALSLEELGFVVDKQLGSHFGIIEDPERVAAIKAAFEAVNYR